MEGKDIDKIVKEATDVVDASFKDKDAIRLGARCVAEIDGKFFLLLEIKIGPPGSRTEKVFIIKISAAQAGALLKAGVRCCQIANKIPMPAPGRDVDLVCAFEEDKNIFLVFSVENAVDRFVLVRVPLCKIC